MPFPTTNATQELPAINQILTSCGQAPVTTLDQTNPEVAIAYATLLQVSREVQSEGWTFNKEYHVEFPTDNNNEIPIANNIIQIKLTENAQNSPSRKRGAHPRPPKTTNTNVPRIKQKAWPHTRQAINCHCLI